MRESPPTAALELDSPQLDEGVDEINIRGLRCFNPASAFAVSNYDYGAVVQFNNDGARQLVNDTNFIF